jgi:predicted ATP-binding protein involved in virulence
MIVTKLSEVFPNCQFIVSTHSPQVLSHVKPKCIYILKNDTKNGIEIIQPSQSYGMNTDRILEDIMEVDARPTKLKEKIHEVFVSIQNNEIEKAKQLITELQIEMNGDDPELVKANVLIKRKNIIGK